MDTIQLNHALRSRTDLPPGVFKGVFALNQLPFVYSLTKPFAFIVNTDPWPLEGKHWIALFCENDGKIEYFDSAGNPPSAVIWNRFGTPSTVVYNPRQLQHSCSSVCGEYCLLFVYCRLKSVSFQDFISCFKSPNRLLNDKKAYNIAHEYFDILPHNRPYPAIDNLCVQISKPLE